MLFTITGTSWAKTAPELLGEMVLNTFALIERLLWLWPPHRLSLVYR